MERPKPSSIAWGAIAAGVTAYDMLCPKGDTLSEAADRGLERHPIATRLAIGTVALHLLNAIPERLDPIHYLIKIKPIERDHGNDPA